MKVQAVPQFIEKLSLIDDKRLFQELGRVVSSIESSSSITSFLSRCQKNQSIYSFRILSYRLYFSIIGSEIYFIDIIDPVKVFSGEASRDPRFNSSINPRFNSSINPRINSSINPRLNSSINPRINSSINPHINSSINPRINSSINPRINSSINPHLNKSFDGLYVYDVQNNSCLYYCVPIPQNDEVLIFFDYSQNETVYFGVKRATGFCVFSFANLDYVGFLESNGKDGYNWFDIDLNWLYFAL